MKIFHRLTGLEPRHFFIVQMLIALFVSLALSYIVEPAMHKLKPVGYDGYIELAKNIIAGNGYVFEPGGPPVFHRAPVYPLLLAPGMLLPDVLHRAFVSLLNSALLAWCGALLFSLARYLFGRQTAVVAWLIFLVNPMMLYVVKIGISCYCQATLYMLLIWMAWRLFQRLRSRREPGIYFALAFGFAMSVAALSHGTMLVHAILLISLFSSIAILKKNFNLLRTMAISASVLLLFVGSWTWRNYKATHAFIPVVGNSGLAYFAGNAHWGITQPARQLNESLMAAEFRHIGLDPAREHELVNFYGFTDIEVEKLANQRAKENMRDHPLEFLRKVGLNAIEYHFPLIYYFIPPAGSEPALLPFFKRFMQMEEKLLILASFVNLILVTLALSGLVHLLKQGDKRRTAILLLLTWAAYAVPYFPFLTWVNHNLYAFGIMPILSLLAAVFLVKPLDHPITALAESREPALAQG